MTIAAGSQSSLWDDLRENIELGRAFMGGSIATGGAGQFPKLQLFNPAGSAKVIQIVQCWAQNDEGEDCSAATNTVAGGTLVNNGRNMRVNSPVSTGEIRRELVLGLAPTVYARLRIPVLGFQTLFDRWGAQLDAGEGHLVISNFATATIRVFWVWIEIVL